MKAFSLTLSLLVCAAVALGEVRALEYAPAPPDNPLKGLVPYAGENGDRFPHSMEFKYLPMHKLMVGPNQFDWRPLDQLLDEVASRGHQAIFRVYLEYPGEKLSVPQFLLDGGLKTFEYRHDNDAVTTPDYKDPRLQQALIQFIRALGTRYDGDPRIGYIAAGLLGKWGEWHNHPRTLELFASKKFQREVMESYEAAFLRTPVLVRYPVGEDHPEYEPNHRRRLGYHDDSFALATLETGRPTDGWYYMALLRTAGAEALDKWKTQPIGGEIRPELWGRIFDANPKHEKAQSFAKCVAETHATWLMDSGMFEQRPTAARRARAIEQVRRMGYEFHVVTAEFPFAAHAELPVRLDARNKGVAPFYHDWRLELAALGDGGELARTWPTEWKLKGILPDEPPHRWETTLDISLLPAGHYRLLLRAVNPLRSGLPLRFANTTQDADRSGWLTLGKFERK